MNGLYIDFVLTTGSRSNLQANGWALADLKHIELKDESLEDSANLPDPDVIAAEIVEDLQAALDEFALIAADLKKS